MLMSSVTLLPRDRLLESGSTLRMLPANAEAENSTPNRRKHRADFIPRRTITILLANPIQYTLRPKPGLFMTQELSCCHPERSDCGAFPTGFFCGSGGCAVEGSAVVAFFYDVGHVNSRSLDSGQPAHPAKSRLDAFLGRPSLGMTLQVVSAHEQCRLRALSARRKSLCDYRQVNNVDYPVHVCVRSRIETGISDFLAERCLHDRYISTVNHAIPVAIGGHRGNSRGASRS